MAPLSGSTQMTRKFVSAEKTFQALSCSVSVPAIAHIYSYNKLDKRKKNVSATQHRVCVRTGCRFLSLSRGLREQHFAFPLALNTL